MKKTVCLLAVPLLLLTCQRLASAQVPGTTPMWNALNQSEFFIRMEQAKKRAEKLNQDLIHAATIGDVAAVRECIEKGANVDAREKWLGQTALMIASCRGHTEVVRMLLDKGADVNARDKAGCTVLMWAVNGCHEEIVFWLLKRGAKYY